MGTVRLNSVEDAICWLPYALGYEPNERLCVLGAGPNMPTGAIAHPHTSEDLLEAAATLGAAYRSHPGKALIVAYTDETDHALDAITALSVIFDGIVDVVDAAVVNTRGEWFTTSNRRGVITDQQRGRFAAEATLAGAVVPSPSREARREILTPDPERVEAAAEAAAEFLTEAEAALAGPHFTEWSNTLGEWSRRRVTDFSYDQSVVSDQDAVRLAMAGGLSQVRDALLDDLDRGNAHQVLPLWLDLMRRLPADLRNGAAAVAATAAWLTGDGALTWMVLDTLDTEAAQDPLARYLTAALENAVNPNQWQGSASIPRE